MLLVISMSSMSEIHLFHLVCGMFVLMMVENKIAIASNYLVQTIFIGGKHDELIPHGKGKCVCFKLSCSDKENMTN